MVAPGANQVATSHHDRGPKQSPKNLPEERTPSHPSGCTNSLRLINCLRAKKTPRSPQETFHLQTPADKMPAAAGQAELHTFILIKNLQRLVRSFGLRGRWLFGGDHFPGTVDLLKPQDSVDVTAKSRQHRNFGT